MAKPKFYLEPRSNKKKDAENDPQSAPIEKQAINIF
ncbi:MAG: hypothetical protein JWP37_1959, partial [Mucilaginibacter sp.]|nr:hypothetical protein [Mucilaginibacter sp.]